MIVVESTIHHDCFGKIKYRRLSKSMLFRNVTPSIVRQFGCVPTGIEKSLMLTEESHSKVIPVCDVARDITTVRLKNGNDFSMTF